MAQNYRPEGYENDEGGYGAWTIYPAEGLTAPMHYDRFEDSVDMGAGIDAALRLRRLAAGPG